MAHRYFHLSITIVCKIIGSDCVLLVNSCSNMPMIKVEKLSMEEWQQIVRKPKISELEFSKIFEYTYNIIIKLKEDT